MAQNYGIPANLFISIHAPMKSATVWDMPSFGVFPTFQSTHPWRVRPNKSVSKYRFPQFQSTHPWRVRHFVLVLFSGCINISIHAPMKSATWPVPARRICRAYFNQRTHEECDITELLNKVKEISISIHAPMKSATSFISMTVFTTSISIHAPMKSATSPYPSVMLWLAYFNPRTHEECDSLQINSVIACFSIIYIANWEKANLIF